MKNNYYMAKIFARQTMIDIRINDIPLLKLNVDADFSSEMPINHLIESSGVQKLAVNISPRLGNLSMNDGAESNVEIWCYDGSKELLVKLDQTCSISLNINKTDNKYQPKHQTAVFLAEVSYQISRWSDCIRIGMDKSILSNITSFYQMIWKILSERDYFKYQELIKKREHNICKALMLEESQIQVRNKMFYECLENGFVLCPIKGKKILDFYADRRIVTVLDEDLKPALRFKSITTGEMLVVELLLGIKNGKKEFSII